MKRNYFVFPLLLAALLPAFRHHTLPAGWLRGTWECKTPKGSIYEIWQPVADKEMHGRSYRVRGQDTMTLETVRLVQEGDSLYYIPTVKDQNNNQPVRFAATVITEKELVFSNPQHDFPQWISYKLIKPDSLVASIGGIIQGKERSQAYPMKKIR